MKKMAWFLTLCLMVGLAAPVAGAESNPYAEPVTITVAYDSTSTANLVPVQNSLFDQMLLEKFNMVFEWEDIDSSSYDTNVRLQFASGDYPDLLMQAPEALVNELALTGKILNWDQYEDRLTDYVKLFDEKTDGGWAGVKKAICASDGLVYGLPAINPRQTARCWHMRAGTLEKMGLLESADALPASVDDLVAMLEAIKAANPDSIPMCPSVAGDSVWLGWDNAYNVQSSYYVDPFTGEYVPYGPATDNWRAMLITLNKLYSEGIIQQDYLNTTADIVNSNITNGVYYVNFDWAGMRTNNLNNLNSQTDPECGWVYDLKMVSANPEQGFTFIREAPYFSREMPAMTDKLTDTEIDRLLAFFNWTATEEASLFLSWGVEGVTYTTAADGNRVFGDEFVSFTNPSGIGVGTYTRYHQDAIPNRSIDAVIACSGTVNIELGTSFTEQGYGYYPVLSFKFDADTQEEVNMLYTLINDTMNEYSNQFVMGLLDPNDDAVWNEYLDALNGCGLQEWAQYYVDYYDANLK
ncbi:MAG: extracellular solute-binding protein [Eubacteriales bacterium]|nr:extracellular solute-binding protein [Eubacteriales bacterium]